jgi:hypothetical protein
MNGVHSLSLLQPLVAEVCALVLAVHVHRTMSPADAAAQLSVLLLPPAALNGSSSNNLAAAAAVQRTASPGPRDQQQGSTTPGAQALRQQGGRTGPTSHQVGAIHHHSIGSDYHVWVASMKRPAGMKPPQCMFAPRLPATVHFHAFPCAD